MEIPKQSVVRCKWEVQKLIDNVDEGKTDRINLVRYTTEGDPIITQLYFNGEDIEIALDNSKDKFGVRIQWDFN